MIRIFSVIAALLLCGSVNAQDWVKKAYPAVFTLKTFDANGSLLASTNGFFTDTQGTAVSGFAPFRGASRAVIIDAQGKEYDVTCMLGADEMYDVAKFRVDISKCTPLPIAAATPADSARLWLMPYSVKEVPQCVEGTLSAAQKVADDYDYYTLYIIIGEGDMANCPVMNDNGEAIGLLQAAGGEDGTEYAVSARYANDLAINALSINDEALNATAIKKDLPDKIDQALLSLYLGGNVLDSASYATFIDDFINKFPNAADGYVYRAQQAVNDNRFDDADADLTLAVKMADKKDDAHYNYAKLIYQKLVLKPEAVYEPWTFDKAVEEADNAIKTNPTNIYHQLKAEILFSAERFDEAFHEYIETINNGERTAIMFFGAARCKEMTGDTATCIAFLDSTINTFSRPLLKDAAPYLLSRAEMLLATGSYRAAVQDMNDYEKLMSSQINDQFYYIRSQAEVEGKLYQQALNDLRTAIEKAPRNAVYYIEKASLEVRVSLYDDAIKTAKESLEVDSQLSDGYLFLGLAQCLKGDKTEGVANLRKAGELGDPQAQELIDKYGQEEQQTAN